jgi:signal transduction histidine kinase/DNA-binding response OmpR family regulator/ligand-binding sensor domain-containing protein
MFPAFFRGLKKFIKIYLFVIILALILIAPGGAHSQSPPLSRDSQPGRNTGMKYMHNYSRKDYNNQSQNWWIIQDKRGIIHVANQGGIMEYDGVSWKETPVLNKIARSLAMDDKGVIYVGGVNEIGFLAPGSKGTRQYFSLKDHLEENHKNFSTVYATHSTKQGIYFRTLTYLFLWNFQQVKAWRAEADRLFVASFLCRGELYIRQNKVGLLKMTGGSLQLIPGGEEFSNKKIYMMVEYDPWKLLIGTRSKGFYLYDVKKAAPIETDALNHVKTKSLYYGIRLSSGDFALATLKGGLIIVDPKGNLKEVFDKSTGLQDDSVKYVFEDSAGNLWLALNEGVTKIEYTSPFSIYNEGWNLPGIVLSVTGHGPDNGLYAGTTSGLYSLKSSSSFSTLKKSKFNAIPGVTGNCWSLLSAGDSLIAAANSGVFRVITGNKNNNKPTQRIIETPAYILHQGETGSQRIWVGTSEGLVSLAPHSKNAQWEVEHQFQNISEEIRTIAEDKNRTLWLGTRTKGVLRIDFPAHGSIENYLVNRYNTSHGLPAGEVHVFRAAGHIMFATLKGVFRFDKNKKVFLPDYTLGEEFAGGEQGHGVFRIKEDRKKNIWFHSKGRNIQAIYQADGTFVLNKKPFLRIPMAQVNTIFPGEEITWFAGADGLVRYDTKVKKNYDLDFQTLIRKVLVNGNLVFAGYKPEEGSINPYPVIEYKNRNLRFEFAAPSFEAESETLYQCLLDGYDEEWSAWSKETKKDYTNIDPGLNTFRVRAKNVYGKISSEAVFKFRVLPPWTKTWWAFLLYALTGLFIIFLVVKWRSWKLVREKQRLENIIKERTKEIKKKNLQLLEQSKKLAEMDRVKSRFFTNISHEFRTPLTLIMGPLEQRLSNCKDKQQQQEIHMMLRNSRRLLNLVNQLLELARLDSGKMKLAASLQNISLFLKNMVKYYEPLALQNKLDIDFHGEEQDITLYFDPEKLEKIMANLLSNAVKYTPAPGKITVSVRKITNTPVFPFGCVEISVRDTGAGIPQNQLPYIFNRFYRANGSHEHRQKGSGIGLALTKELVALHHGEINVHSSDREGHSRGTEFIVRLPLGKEHLQPGETVESEETGNRLVFEEPGQLTTADTYAAGEVTEAEEPPDNHPKTEESRSQTGKPMKPIAMVVEDNPIERLYIKTTLETQFNVIEAADGKEGIKQAKEIIPDLIVSDIIMPGADGCQLCRLLKKDVLTSHIPIILLTVKGSEEDILQGLETGADDYIIKPFNKSILMVRARNLIDLRHQLQIERKNRMSLQPGEILVSSIDEKFYKKLQDILETHMSDPDFNVEALSRILSMSRATLYRKIYALTGNTPTQFIRSYRLKRAGQLLEAHAGNISEVADRVGFPDKSYFSRCFKEQFHCVPSEYPPWRTDGRPGPDEAEADTDTSPTRAAVTTGIYEPGQDVILVVEDNNDARHYIRGCLEPDYRVVEAADGTEGLARAMEIIPDLIISDIIMPGIDGYELCEILKKDVRTSHIPIVLLTAKASEESIIRGLETGADDYITKPFNAKILTARIKNLIRLRSHLQKKRNLEMMLLPIKISESEIDRTFMKKLNAVIEKNLSEPDFNVEQLAKKLHMSSTTLYRKLLALSGEIPSDYIRSCRLRRAAQLLQNNFGSVTEVAFEVGFNSRAYFTRCFKETFHQLPSVYMAAIHNGGANTQISHRIDA